MLPLSALTEVNDLKLGLENGQVSHTVTIRRDKFLAAQ